MKAAGSEFPAADVFFSWLGVVNGMALEPVLIAHPANIPDRAGSNAGGEAAALPGDAGSEANNTTQCRAQKCARWRCAPGTRMTSEHTEASAHRSRAQCNPC